MTASNNVVPIKAKLDNTVIAEKRAKLASVAAQLKTEFFGLDTIIDKVISAISAWYIFPDIITRPVIINLWGMTGVGKTQLVRRIVSLLQFNEKFVEVQMDGGSVTSSYNANSITKLLGTSTIDEGKPGILLLDEIQRFRTVDEVGGDVKVERFQDVWTLLSDGKFSADASIFAEIEMMLAYRAWDQDGVGTEDDDDLDEDEEEKPKKAKKQRAFKVYPYEAKNLKKLLRLSESVSEIMKWDADRTSLALADLKQQRVSWEIDYTKLLIFISGNLDSAFTGSDSTDDCDTDADFYHDMTKKISSTDIKRHLKRRFRPEQIARMGNNHIIYPSMSKLSYERLIESTCKRYIDEMTAVSDIVFTLDKSIHREIYNNSVYPTQGTRPVFSSIHMIFSGVLVDATFWAIENGYLDVGMKMSADAKSIVVTGNNASTNFPVDLELNLKKSKTTLDTKTLVAVHETGHGFVFAALTKSAPIEIKINPASFEGGYMLPTTSGAIMTKQDHLDEIATYLAGTVAEEVFFGANNRSSGASHDLSRATKIASDMVRNYGLGDTLARVDAQGNGGVTHVTDLSATNKAIEQILNDQYARAMDLIKGNKPLFARIVNALLKENTIAQQEFIELAKDDMVLSTEIIQYPFNKEWLKQQA
jgi:cell division protease FtsH